MAATFALGALVPAGAIAAPVSSDPPPDAEHLEIVAEQYNLARLRVQRATAALEATDRRIEAAQLRVRLVQARARSRAASLYVGAGAATSFPIGDARHVSDVRRRSRYLDAAEAPDRALVDDLQLVMAQLRTERQGQRDARDLLERDARAAEAMKRRLESLAAQAAAAARAEQSARDAATKAAATSAPTNTAPTTARSGSAPSPTTPSTGAPRSGPTTPPPTSPHPTPPPPNPTPPTGSEPPVSSGASGAVAFARAQLGKPYAFAMAGPATFDCSGLTMAAWASVGVRMAHYSGSQAAISARLSYSQLQPGDIVIFYSDLHHVGLYIGGGMMIHAPQTGDVVKIAPAWRDNFQWGVRPH
ncbi:MAG: NlpC/P60 family protein [Acidimicrobiia bacterium]